MPTLTRLPAGSQPGDVVSVIQRDGGVIIEDFLTDEQLDGIRADLLPKIAALPAGSDDFAGRHTRRLERAVRPLPPHGRHRHPPAVPRTSTGADQHARHLLVR